MAAAVSPCGDLHEQIPLSTRTRIPPQRMGRVIDSWCSSALGFAILTGQAVLAISCAHGDRGAIAYVAVVYLDLLLLLVCQHLLKKAPPDSPARDRLRYAVWPLTSLLTVMGTWRMAALLPLALALTMWIIAAAGTVGTFYALFVYGEKDAGRMHMV